MKSLCIFCGSASGGGEGMYLKEAQEVGRWLADHDIELVYGGASIGVMGEIANACLEFGGRVVGVIPESLLKIEVGHKNLSELHVVESMHERKQKMYDLSDAFLALPGGFGTLDELCEILTWAQLKHHKKPCYILNSTGFYDHLLTHFDHLVTEKFLSLEHRRLLNEVKKIDEVLASKEK